MDNGAGRQTVRAIAARTFQLGTVPFLNARPLLAGLAEQPRLRLCAAVPSRLAEMLRAGRVDAALIPSVDYQRYPQQWLILPAGCIGSDGPTMTVRIYSQSPLDKIAVLACDSDSHTSVVLAQLVLRKLYRCDVRVEPLDRRYNAGDHEAMLLIGDKVVTSAPRGFAYELDLGQAWSNMTGLPFVFAVWAARQRADVAVLNDLLQEARLRGTANLPRLARRWAPLHGWPVDVAVRYLRALRYELDERALAGLRMFYRLAGELGLLNGCSKPIRLLSNA